MFLYPCIKTDSSFFFVYFFSSYFTGTIESFESFLFLLLLLPLYVGFFSLTTYYYLSSLVFGICSTFIWLDYGLIFSTTSLIGYFLITSTFYSSKEFSYSLISSNLCLMSSKSSIGSCLILSSSESLLIAFCSLFFLAYSFSFSVCIL
jgi:hypothetical protein